MVDGTNEGLAEAVAMITANPHPAHLTEYRIVVGGDKSVAEMIDESLRNSAIVAYGIRDGEAMVGGIGKYQMLRHSIWLLTTATIAKDRRSRVWLEKRGRVMLALADRRYPWPNTFYQAIPASYTDGLNYARHMGFKENGTMQSPACPDETLVIMERMVSR